MLRLSKLLWILVLVGVFMALGNDRAEAKTTLASWYGPGFEGQPTASGESYDPYGYTAAHKTMRLGTELTVSYGGRSVNVVVNDRGPYVGDRELDLSQGAAEHLGLTEAGVDYVDYWRTGGGYGGGGRGYDAGYETYPETTDYAGGGGYNSESYASGGGAGVGGAYVVQPGDTMSGIAAELGTTVEDLAAANGVANPDLVYAGQTLYY